jgi:hypothetical protein
LKHKPNKNLNVPGMTVQACNSSTWEPEAGYSKFEASMGYTARPSPKQNKAKSQ